MTWTVWWSSYTHLYKLMWTATFVKIEKSDHIKNALLNVWCCLVTDLSRSNVVTVGVGAAASSAIQLTVIDLHTHFAVTCPSFNTHTRNVTWTHIHTLCLYREREEKGGRGSYKGRSTALNPTVNNSIIDNKPGFSQCIHEHVYMKEVGHLIAKCKHGKVSWQQSGIYYKWRANFNIRKIQGS